ncbi:hypothetical protein Tco_1573841 [Tanacetum coccineum]
MVQKFMKFVLFRRCHSEAQEGQQSWAEEKAGLDVVFQQVFMVFACVFGQEEEQQHIQTTEGKVDTGKAVDASLVNTESIGTESKEQDTSNRSGNDAHADDAEMRPIYDEEPMVEVQTTAEINIFATRQQHTEQPEFNNEGKVDQNAEQCDDIRSIQ